MIHCQAGKVRSHDLSLLYSNVIHWQAEKLRNYGLWLVYFYVIHCQGGYVRIHGPWLVYFWVTHWQAVKFLNSCLLIAAFWVVLRRQGRKFWNQEYRFIYYWVIHWQIFHNPYPFQMFNLERYRTAFGTCACSLDYD